MSHVTFQIITEDIADLRKLQLWRKDFFPTTPLHRRVMAEALLKLFRPCEGEATFAEPRTPLRPAAEVDDGHKLWLCLSNVMIYSLKIKDKVLFYIYLFIYLFNFFQSFARDASRSGMKDLSSILSINQDNGERWVSCVCACLRVLSLTQATVVHDHLCMCDIFVLFNSSHSKTLIGAPSGLFEEAPSQLQPIEGMFHFFFINCLLCFIGLQDVEKDW